MENKKRKTFSVGAAIEKRDKLEADTSTALQDRIHTITSNPFLAPIVNPTYTIQIFLMEARIKARQFIQSKGLPLNSNSSIVEVEARLGIIKAPFGTEEKRITSSGAKTMELQGRDVLVHAFLCSTDGFDASKVSSNSSCNIQNCNTTRPPFEGGITRAHFTKWTSMGLSEPSPISLAYGVKKTTTTADEVAQIKKDLIEHETVETVYGGYSHNRRVCFPGEHPSGTSGRGKMESKMKLQTMDVALPSAHYDLRLTLSTEERLDDNLTAPPPRYQSKRLKRRRSYNRRDKSFAWQLDVTEVTTSSAGSNEQDYTVSTTTTNSDVIGYEIEVELLEASMLKLIHMDDTQAQQFSKQLAEQLWWMMRQINPLSDVLDVDSYLREHVQQDAVKLALAQCYSLKKFLHEGKKEWTPAISATSSTTPLVLATKTMNFIGSMPVNFQRHNIEDIQRSENSYYLSEKTDGVRYLMIFTGSTVVLLDRSHKGAQPKPVDGGLTDPMEAIAALVQPGTVLDGEVVMHRELRRPIFIVFDVLCCGSTPILHYPFEERLRYLNQGLFAITNTNGGKNNKDLLYATSAAMLSDKSIALPLVKKNFVRRTELDKLLSHVQEERGVRTYKNGECHNHSTDGIIFQPNRPYVISTDVHLLKWKYLDTVTIDVELLPPQQQKRHYASKEEEDSDEDVLRVGVLGDDGTIVEMTRFVKLPRCERLRLEADRAESGANIAEVGFDPDTGDWFYQTMRPDKKTSNHITTVLGTLLELAESLGTNELRYRMSVKGGQRDTYRKDIRSMQKQLLDFQRKKNAG